MKGEKEIPAWYQDQLEKESTSSSLVITDRLKIAAVYNDTAEGEGLMEPVPKPTAYFTDPSEWVRE